MNVLEPEQWARLSPQLDELLDLAAPARQSRLEQIASEDPEAAQALRSLLLARDEADNRAFLKRPAAYRSTSPTARPGDVIGAWRLVEPVGQGATGSVWRGRRCDGEFEGEVAIKLLHSETHDRRAQARFQREGAILARLRHPNIAQIFDAGVSANGQPYLLLEFVQGNHLDQWCESRRMDVRSRVELFMQVLEAVAYAHSQLVIHRDLKPSNILVDDGGRVKLLDFGIARLIAAEDAADTGSLLTQHGALLLTAAYAAPEQFASGPLSTATDVYALGVVLYQLLTGTHPSGLAAGSPLMAYMNSATEGHRQPASLAQPARRRELRGDLDAILAKACSPAPTDRYAGAEAFTADLQRHLRGEPILARPATPWVRTIKLVRRHPVESAVFAAVLLAIPAGAHLQAAVLASFGFGTAVAVWQARRAHQQTVRARAEQRLAQEVKRFIALAFEQATPRDGAGGLVTAADLLHAAQARVDAELKGQPRVAAELLVLIGDSFHALGDTAAAHAVLPSAVEQCERAFGRTHQLTLHARSALAEARVVQGDLAGAERMLPALIKDLLAAMPASVVDLLGALRQHSYALTKRGDEGAAIRTLEEAVELGCQHLRADHREVLVTSGLLGNTLATFGRDTEAAVVLEPAVALAQKLYGDQRPNTLLAKLESYFASSLIALDRLSESEALLRQVLDDQLALDGRHTHRNVYTRSMLALVRARRGDHKDALVLMQMSIDADAALSPVPTIDSGTLLSKFGEMCVEAGRLTEGLAALERAEVVIRNAGGAGQVYPARRRRVRWASALLLAGRPSDALAETAALMADDSAEDWIAAETQRVRIGALRALGRVSEADELLEGMLRLNSAHCTATNRVRALIEAAHVHRCLRRNPAANACAEEAARILKLTQQVEGSPLLVSALAACVGDVETWLAMSSVGVGSHDELPSS